VISFTDIALLSVGRFHLYFIFTPTLVPCPPTMPRSLDNCWLLSKYYDIYGWLLQGMGADVLGDHRAGKKASDAPPSTASNSVPLAKKAKIGPGQCYLLVYADLANKPTASTRITQSTQEPGFSPSSAVSQTNPHISPIPSGIATSIQSAPGATLASTTTFQSNRPAPSPSPPGLTTTQTLPRLAESDRANLHAATNTAYTSPSNPSYKLTASELNALRMGRPNARGDTVFFKPGFIDENPWKVLHHASREERGVRNEG
jgi:hypothetical protein